MIELSIESLSYGGGRGVGRHKGRVFFVPWTAPGDRILARTTRLKKNFGEAEMVQLLQASPLRVEPLCPVFGQCGGCRFQHLSYKEQLHQKDLYIRQALKFLPSEVVEPIWPSPKPFYYRSRVQVHLSHLEFGFLKAKSNALVPIQGCPISEEPIHDFLGSKDALKTLKSFGDKKVEVALTSEGELQFNQARFSQVNRYQNENLIKTVCSWAEESFQSLEVVMGPVLDLYAGSGNLTFPLYEQLKHPMIAVELSQPSVQKANEDIGDREIVFFQEDVAHFLHSPSARNLKKVDLVVSDPPREGLSQKVLEGIFQLNPFFIIHVGCHLMNFARDLKRLSERGYVIHKVRPLDMFPQTDHVELVALVGRP